MRFEYSPEDGPELASAEALQQIATQLERIADEMENDGELTPTAPPQGSRLRREDIPDSSGGLLDEEDLIDD